MNKKIVEANELNDGKQDGLSEGYHENGQLMWKGNWKDGELDGLWEEY
tara:strand:+ start:594 stop:737 length:144 start_codon:yes stop_codon:yes gene_type:complete